MGWRRRLTASAIASGWLWTPPLGEEEESREGQVVWCDRVADASRECHRVVISSARPPLPAAAVAYWLARSLWTSGCHRGYWRACRARVFWMPHDACGGVAGAVAVTRPHGTRRGWGRDRACAALYRLFLCPFLLARVIVRVGGCRRGVRLSTIGSPRACPCSRSPPPVRTPCPWRGGATPMRGMGGSGSSNLLFLRHGSKEPVVATSVPHPPPHSPAFSLLAPSPLSPGCGDGAGAASSVWWMATRERSGAGQI